jgi:cellulose synthase operon protein C
MAKSMVERYEQLLLQDPTSAVFVELAKVLLEKGEPVRAIEVCQQGLCHHATSVIGRVLWGKALLHLGKPAEAMEQFDQAVAIDKENAHAYNLIGEVLVQRGLYRSALPILRRAAALQPNDARVKVWLEQTQQALSGGPPPVLAELPGLTANALAPQPLAEEPPPAQAPPAADDPDEEKPEVTGVIRLDQVAAEAALREAIASPPASPPPGEEQAPRVATPSRGRAQVYMFPPNRALAPPRDTGDLDEDTPTPFSGGEPDLEDTPPPSAPARRQAHEPHPEGEEPSGGLLPELEPPTHPGPAFDEEGSAAQGLLPDVEGPASEEERAAAAEQEPSAAPEARSVPSGGGLLGDLPLPDEEPAALPAAARVSDVARTAPVARPRTATPAAGSKRVLLDDIPDVSAAQAPAAAPRRSTSSQVDAAAVAAAYEKELREKAARKEATPSFFSRYGLKLVVIGVPVALILVGVVVYFLQRAAHGGQNLAQVLERTERVVSQDTRASLREALTLIELAHKMDKGNSRAWALKAYTHALLYTDHGGAPQDRTLALEALERPGVRDGHAGLSLATDALVADDHARATARRELLASQEESSELQALAGTLLLEQRQTEKALERFKRALAISPRNVRALVALGHYYQDNDDHPNALKVYGTAREFSPEHPRVRMGLAEARLVLGEELEASLADMQALSGDAELPEPLRARQQLAQGRLLAELGRYGEALGLLAGGTKGPLAFDFLLALGDASRAAGKLPEAQQAYEAALKLQPKSEPAREGLARALLERDRVKEALSRLEGDGSRKAALVRAAAYARLEEWKKVRAELEKTRVNNRYPPEAVGYLAMADTMEGKGEQAREVLEKAVRAVKQPRTELQVALGRVYWRLRSLDKAQASFEEAMKDPRDYEAPCAMGRLLLSRGVPELALRPLSQAVERNGFHGEARDALGRALLALGRTEEGLQQFEAWRSDNPDSAEALKGYALALLHSGRHKEAQEAVNRAVRLAPSDAEGHRLRAVILFSTGDAKAAFTALERSFKLDPREPETLCEIAHGYLRQDKVDDAAAVFEKVRTESPDTPCGLVGEHYADPSEGGRAAAKALQSIAEKAPAVWDKAFAQTAIARVLLNAGGGALKEARAAADEAVRLAPSSGRAHLALGLVALKQRQEEPALAALTKAVELEPTHGMARLALADVLARKQEELPRALQEYEAFLRLAGSSEEAKRVKKVLPNLKRRVK